jgi:hypothetical protein
MAIERQLRSLGLFSQRVAIPSAFSMRILEKEGLWAICEAMIFSLCIQSVFNYKDIIQ